MGAGHSKSDSCAARVAACWFGVVSGRSYNQVVAISNTAPEAMARREANFGTASHVLAASVNSLSRAPIAAITRVANQGLSVPASEVTPLKISRVARISLAASRQLSHAATWARSAAGKSWIN